MSDAKIMEGILRVELAKVFIPDRRGPYPCCKNKLGTMFCCRCGRNMRKSGYRRCKAVPRSQRWTMG